MPRFCLTLPLCLEMNLLGQPDFGIGGILCDQLTRQNGREAKMGRIRLVGEINDPVIPDNLDANRAH